MRPADTLRHVGKRALAGEPWRVAVRDFLDGFGAVAQDTRQILLDEEPPPFDEFSDVELAALAQHLGLHHDLVRPAWCVELFVREVLAP